ncbi:MAG: UV DNA damage repair endonuclease UvsE [Firmicutes bacterium]|nr:UV DNA damage repair endonuclease UvsE [Bacillota bacterium]
MKIRLGYVAISKVIENTTSKTITYTNFKKDKDIKKIYNLINNNLNALEEILNYNIKNNIHFYRLTSKLIPLATHKDVEFDYINPFKNKFKKIGKIIKNNNLRIDLHPDQFAVLNSINKEVVENTIKILEYHYKILDVLNIKDKVIILHVGGNNFGKEKSITRFINNFNKLPEYLKQCIVIENDDKIFNIKDTLYISKKLNIPMVLDYHHYLCNNDGEKIEDYIEDIFNTWHKKTPKIHFSSPKSNLKKEFRAHHDYINLYTFIEFIEKIKFVNKDFDIMIEAKAKDDALYRLVRGLKYKTNYNFIDETSFIINK